MASVRVQFHAFAISARRGIACRQRPAAVRPYTFLCSLPHSTGTLSSEGVDGGASAAAVLDTEDDVAALAGDETMPSRQRSKSYFPKKGQDLELVCETLAFKGKGVCKVADTGFVVLCERALPGERLIARIVERKRGFAHVRQIFKLFASLNPEIACRGVYDSGKVVCL